MLQQVGDGRYAQRAKLPCPGRADAAQVLNGIAKS